MYYVQEIIGGYRQNSCFEGSLDECKAYVKENNSNKSLDIVSEDNYEIDYL